jgi:tyrosine-protein phosphatase YwqE
MDERPIVIASDAHNVVKRKPGLQRAYDALAERFGQEAAGLMCQGNPTALLENRPLRIARIPRAPEKPEAHGRMDRLKRAFRRG